MSSLYNWGSLLAREFAATMGPGSLLFCLASHYLLSLVEAGVIVPILQQEQQVNPDGSYKYSYATGNGIMVVEQGRVAHGGTPAEAQAVEGTYTYLNSEGTLVNVRYFADEGGFRAVPNVIHRPSARFQASAPGDVRFHSYDELQRALHSR